MSFNHSYKQSLKSEAPYRLMAISVRVAASGREGKGLAVQH
jgi:hypothetical protein